MYSYTDRLRAVELYIRLGKRLNATIRQLGYRREYIQHLDLRIEAVARAPKYSEAEKQALLEHYRTHDRCISATMRDRRDRSRCLAGVISNRALSAIIPIVTAHTVTTR